MKFGICCGPQTMASPALLIETAHNAGADYLEFGVASVMSNEGRDFETLQKAFDGAAVRVEAFNSFVPASHRLTGPDVDLPAALEYCRVALGRCHALGADVVVLGSAGARRVPDGFDSKIARQQFLQFCRELAPIAQDANVVIAIEPLNSREDNLVLSVAQGAQIVDEVAHPSIQLLADLYHIEEESQSLQETGDAGARLRHTHVADVGRVAPGFAENGEAPFTEFFRQLRRAGYDHLPQPRCSFEGEIDDFAAQAKPLLAHLHKRWAESAL
jgi:D-psicose/D-tagatose/L-ribulose 3-epimerase